MLMVETTQGRCYQFFFSLAEKIVFVRWYLLLIVLFLTIFFGWKMKDLRFDNSDEVWFVPGDPSLEIINKFKKTFGNYDDVYLLFETQDAFSPQTIRLIDTLVEDLRTNVPYVKDSVWLGNVENIEKAEDTLHICQFMEKIPENEKETRELFKRASSEALFINNLLSSDSRIIGVILEMDTYPSGNTDPKMEIAPAVRKVLDKEEYRCLHPHLIGSPILHYDFQTITVKESTFFLIICVLADMGLLLWVGRGLRGAMVPAAIMITTLIWTMGMVSLLGFNLNILFILFPTLMICVNITDSLHVIAMFHRFTNDGLGRYESITRALGTVGLACLLTSVTTLAGFISFLSVGIKPFKEMAVYSSFGIIVAFILTIVLVPILYSFGKSEVSIEMAVHQPKREDIFDRLLKAVYYLNVNHPKKILALFVILSIASVVGYMNLEVETNTVANLLKSVPVRQSYDYVDARMGGPMTLEVMLDTGQEGGVIDPPFLHQLQKLQQFVDNHPMVSKSTSIIDLLGKIHYALHDDAPLSRLPETRKAAAQELLLYESSGGEKLDRLISSNFAITRLHVRTRLMDTRDLRLFIKDMEKFSAGIFPQKVNVQLTGSNEWVKSMNDLVGQGQKRSFLTAGIMVGIIMAIVLRSVLLGLISMAPNVFPVMLTLGVMGIFGIYLDLPAMCFSSVVLGVAVDDTIHYYIHYRQAFARTQDYREALKDTLNHTGRPVIFATLTIMTGLSLLGFSHLLGIVKFGLLGGFAFFWGLIADLFMSPALLFLFKPLGSGK
jgi:uncharacterized protein